MPHCCPALFYLYTPLQLLVSAAPLCYSHPPALHALAPLFSYSEQMALLERQVERLKAADEGGSPPPLRKATKPGSSPLVEDGDGEESNRSARPARSESSEGGSTSEEDDFNVMSQHTPVTAGYDVRDEGPVQTGSQLYFQNRFGTPARPVQIPRATEGQSAEIPWSTPW